MKTKDRYFIFLLIILFKPLLSNSFNDSSQISHFRQEKSSHQLGQGDHFRKCLCNYQFISFFSKGDTIYDGMPPHRKFGGLKEWKQRISQLEGLKKLDINTIVPAHGKLCAKEEIECNLTYLENLCRTK